MPNKKDKKNGKNKIIVVLAGIIILAAGVGMGYAGEYHFAQVQQHNQLQAFIQQKAKEFQKGFRKGNVVSFDAKTVTMDVEAGGGDVHKQATYNLTTYTAVQEGNNLVSKYGLQPDLAALGVKPGYYVVLFVNTDNNILDLYFNSNGDKNPPPSGVLPVQQAPTPITS